MNAAQQQAARLQRLQNLVLGELILRKVVRRWGSSEKMVAAAQAGDSVASELVKLVQRGAQRREIQWPSQK
jgi:hypothetical protein